MMKKRIAALLAFAMAVSFLPTVTMADSASTPEVTVVGKRITDGDPYFEISLEVNGKYEDYSAVNVVLEYDPAIIVPAESWDEGAGPADMKENTTWATRRALPTLGKETWSSHIALAYQTETEYDTDGTTVKTPSKGYLYLGAEYSGETANTSSPEPTDGTAAATPEASPEATAEADPDPHQNPVVVARFMYAAPTKYPSGTAEEIADERANTKEKLEALWQTGEYPAKASATAADHWDNDWSKNKILTIAPDDIAFESPAQFPFAYYNANFEERAYMHTFPTAAPTTDPSASPATTSVPTAVHTVYANGSRIAETDRLKDTDIEVVLGQGKSAKLTGGLSLNDIFVIVFFDWDDSILGTLTSGLSGGSANVVNDVNTYVKKKFIYPDLQELPYDTMTDSEIHARENSYRGEFPFSGPVGSTEADLTMSYGTDTVTDGSKYPITNKLEYTLAGKKLYNGAPFAGGWTRVLTADIDYDAENAAAVADGDSEPYPGLKAKISPRSMGNTWSSLGKDVLLEKTPLLDTLGIAVDDTGTPLSPQPSIGDDPIYSFDFSDVEQTDLDDGVLYVKAVYETGTNINGRGDNTYHTFGPEQVDLLSTSGGSSTYSIKFQYKRINRYGYGVERTRKPGIGMTIQQLGASNSTTLAIYPDNTDIMDVELTPTDAVETVDYDLRETYNDNVITGSAKSEHSKLGQFNIGGPYGLAYHMIVDPVLEQAYDYSHGVTPPSNTWLAKDTIYDMKLSSDEYGSEYSTAKERRTCQTVLMDLVTAADNKGIDYKTLSWYQIQYACCNDGAYVSDKKAKKYCDEYPVLWEVFLGLV